jgi:hypothetical protein
MSVPDITRTRTGGLHACNAPYVILLHLIEAMLQISLVAIYVDLLFAYTLRHIA